MVPEDNQRLSRINTLWTIVRKAHDSHLSAAGEAQRVMMERYCTAVHRYLLGALRNEDAADELFQEFALRFLRGDFARVDESRGRFRDYLRTVLVHLINDHHRARRRSAQPLPDNVAAQDLRPPDENDPNFIDSWRVELTNHAWAALEKSQPAYHALLLFHIQNPDMPSRELAEQLTQKLGKKMTSTNVRVTLHRARERFAELLLDEVAQSLADATDQVLLDELAALRLTKVCSTALEKRGIKPSPADVV